MNYKRILAVGLAASMVMGSSVVAFAAEGTGTGSGSLDVVEKSDVFQVQLPTDSGTMFNYILDPTGVIKATSAEKYSGATFGEGTVFFANAATTEGGATSYSATSDAIKAVNKSTMDVQIKVKASVAAASGITMSSTDTFDSADTTAGLYLALKDSDTNNSNTAITTSGVELTSTIAALADAYETKYVDGKYVKQLEADATGFKEYSFQLTGACNPKGKWTGLTETPPTVNVVWSIADPTAPVGPQVTVSTSGAISITGLTAEQNYTSSDITAPNGSTYDSNVNPIDWNTDNWSVEEGGSITGQLGSEWMDWLIENGGNIKFTIKLSDNTTKECTVTLAK